MLNSMDCQIPMTMRMIPILNVITPYDKVHIQWVELRCCIVDAYFTNVNGSLLYSISTLHCCTCQTPSPSSPPPSSSLALLRMWTGRHQVHSALGLHLHLMPTSLFLPWYSCNPQLTLVGVFMHISMQPITSTLCLLILTVSYSELTVAWCGTSWWVLPP